VKRPKRAPILTLEGLERWFETATPEPPCEGVSMMNGFLTGLACGPIFLQPADSDDAAHPFRDDGAQCSGMMPPG
jgi:uncharacterized protein